MLIAWGSAARGGTVAGSGSGAASHDGTRSGCPVGVRDWAGSAAAGVASGWANTTPNSADTTVAAAPTSQVVDWIRLRVSANRSRGRLPKRI